MSCKICEDEPIFTYVRIGNGNVEIRGCADHLSELIRLLRVANEKEKKEAING